MKLARGFVVFIASFFTLIGDLVIALIFICLTLLRIFLATILAIIKLPFEIINSLFGKNRVVEKEIFNSSKKSLPKSPKIRHTPSLRKHLHLPHFKIRRRKRGRPRLPVTVPANIKFKYIFIGLAVSFIFIFIPFSTYTFITSLPDPNALAQQKIAQTTKIYDRNNTLLYQIFANQNRTVVPLSSIPKDLQNATIAIEDKNFYTTPGIDILAIARSIRANAAGEQLQGGSTITQQLIKARLLTPDRTIERKAKEIVLALWAERIYTKEEILEMYLNQVPYGGTAWGVEAASQTYFDKEVNELTLAQSAFLAGLPQAPTTYSPYGQNPNLWKERQRDVLSRMVALGFITEAAAKKAEAEKLTFKEPRQILRAPHFVMYIKDKLIEKYGITMVERGGLNITTSLDLKTQALAQKIVEEEVDKSAHLNFTNAATLITNPTNGDILAMVGGRDYYNENSGNYNVTTALRQPGSTIKIVTYTGALLSGLTAASTIQDRPVTYAANGAPPYSPVNYDGKFRGIVTLRSALGNSINIPAVKTLNKIGVETMIDLAQNLGITTWEDSNNYGLALTLGSAEVKMVDMATVYGVFANAGNRVEINPIIKIVDSQGNTLEDKTDIKQKRVIPEEIAFIISDILADNKARIMEFGANSPLKIPGHRVSVKTGTTDNKRDNWTIGYTKDLLIAVWVGNNDNSPMNPKLASGITGAAPIWNKLMNNLLKGSDPAKETQQIPNNIVVKPCGGKNEYFVKGTEKLVLCKPLTSLKEQEEKNTP